MSPICRTCLKATGAAYLFINSTSTASNSDFDARTIKDKILECVPELDLNLTPNAVLCDLCFIRFEAAYNFRQTCLQSEKEINGYFEKNGCVELENLLELVHQSADSGNIKTECIETVEHEPVEAKPLVDGTFKYDFLNGDEDNFADDNNVEVSEPELDSDIVTENNVSDTSGSQDVDSQNLLVPQSFDYVRAEHQLTCDVCLAYFTTKIGLAVHQRSHATECRICKFVGKNRNALGAHERRYHADENKFNCDLCSFSTNFDTVFIEHSRFHTGEKPFSCNTCTQKFTYYSIFKRHMKKHAIYKCSKCSFYTKHPASLEHHMKTHTGEKPYQCTKCDFRTADKDTLKKHTARHAFQCHICSFSSDAEVSVLDHLIGHKHKGEMQELPIKYLEKMSAKRQQRVKKGKTRSQC